MNVRRIFGLIFLLSIIYYSSLNNAWAQKQQTPKEPKIGIDVNKLLYLSSEAKEKIAKNGFVIVMPKYPEYSPKDEALSIYSLCKDSHFPVFVTSDVMLHVSHLLFDWSLRFLEISSLKQDLLNLTDTMLSQSLFYYGQIQNKELKNAALKNAIFFSIAKSILAEGSLKDVPKGIKDIMEKELALINKHEGFSISPLFGYKEDYSQYIPRGHYSRSPEFERYFKAMMWYGRMGFRLTPIRETKEGYILDKEAAITETLQAILICRALTETKVKGETALAVWERIYETTSFFAGKSDDVSVKEYNGLIDKIYGKNFPLSSISDEKKITEFIKEARQLKKPKILSTFVTDVSSRTAAWEVQTQALRFMGQRFTLDSHIFQNLVYDKVKWYAGKDPKPFTAVFANGAWFRGFPRGLDVMAVFGSEVAEEILNQEKDTDFEGYQQHFLELRKEYSFEDKDRWTQDLYRSRLWAFKSILEKPALNVPYFMQSGAWLKKQLNACLGSWTELKHDTIIYTKQPYSLAQRAFSVMGKGGIPLPPETVHGYVEPVPELYSRVKESVAQLRLKLTSLGFPSDKALEDNFKQFEEILTSLERISKKELAGEMPDEAEYELVEDTGDRLRRILGFAHYIDVAEEFRTEMDNKMPVAADVFTDVNSNQVLEEAVGRPAEIFVIANVDGKDKICLGAAYSYYEFKQPMGNRLTDEEWRSTVEEDKQPPLPEWTEDIVVNER